MKRIGMLLMLVLLAMVPAAALAAQQGGPYSRQPNGSNDYRVDDLQITRAQYGVGNRVMDVTNRLRSQVRNGQINLQVTGDSMGGDPARGTRKTLYVQYTINGRQRELNVNEGDYLRLPGSRNDNNDDLQITRAQYGAGNRVMDVTNRLRSQVRNGQINLQVTGDSMGGDPARGTPKTLYVQYTINGRQRELNVNEGDYLRLPGRRDDNDYGLQITRAIYGAGNRSMDVTNRLNSQIRNGQVNIRVTADTMGGDPARGQVKALMVWYAYNGRQGQTTVNYGGYLRLPSPSNDNRGDDLQITRAQYGAGNRVMDVTNRLRSQVRNGQIDLQVTGDSMGGDPARGTPKTLYVQYTINGRQRELTVNEGDYLRLPGRRNDNNDDLQITRAQYGAGNRVMDVTNRLRSQVRNGQIDLQVTGDSMGGDPARGTPKTLYVQYAINGRQREITVNEGNYLQLPDNSGPNGYPSGR